MCKKVGLAAGACALSSSLTGFSILLLYMFWQAGMTHAAVGYLRTVFRVVCISCNCSSRARTGKSNRRVSFDLSVLVSPAHLLLNVSLLSHLIAMYIVQVPDGYSGCWFKQRYVSAI